MQAHRNAQNTAGVLYSAEWSGESFVFELGIYITHGIVLKEFTLSV